MNVDHDHSKLNNARLWRALYWGCAALIMLLPVAAMQFTSDVGWTSEDFTFAAVLLGLTGGVLEAALRTGGQLAFRIGAAMALGACFLLVWVNGAVGIIGNEDDPANLMFAGVILIAMAGSLVAGFRADRMARAMQVTAGAQVTVFLIALASGAGFIPFATLFFTGVWLGSAALFAKAARAQATA